MESPNTQVDLCKDANQMSDADRIKLLFEYTKFHIGLYATLVAALIALAGSKFADQWQLNLQLLWSGIIGVLIAGWAGGVIAAGLPQTRTFAEFWNKATGPFWWRW